MHDALMTNICAVEIANSQQPYAHVLLNQQSRIAVWLAWHTLPAKLR
jgi:hypothetical protein